MRELIELRDYWLAHAGDELALCTLVRKTGSAYRALGAKKIIVRAGGACGLLSGGCLEPDIERTVRESWDKLPFLRAFSTMSPEDALLGYQTGCAGEIELLCMRLPHIAQLDLYLPFGSEAGPDIALSLAPETLGQRRAAQSTDKSSEVLFIDRWQMPVRLHIVGCGIDARPYAAFAALLGWDIHFLDYRESMAANLPGQVTITSLAELPAHIAEGPRSAVLLMTHNYQADLVFLRALAGKTLGYIGSLGPRKRFEQMRAELGLDPPAAWDDILHAPAGLFAGSHTPASIALSVVAQIEALLGG